MARSSKLTRALDQTLGALATQVLSRAPRPIPKNPRKILFIQPTAIGDTLIGSGAVEAIARCFPRAQLVIAHGPSNKLAVKMLSAEVEPVEIGFNNPVKAVRAVRALAPDMIIDMTPWPYTTALVARLSGVWSAGFAPAINIRGKLFDLAVEHRTDRHEIENLRALAYGLGATGDCCMAIRREAGDLPPDLGVERLVLAHVSAGGARAAAKSWPIAHWADLTRALAADGWRVGFTGVSADATAVNAVLAKTDLPEDQVFSLCGKLSLAQLAELLARVPLLVSVDTGILHLSAAVEGRAIGLHGPTYSKRWGSVSSRAIGLDAPHPAAGFINYGWEDQPHSESIMPSLAAETVIAEARAILASKQAA